MEGKKLRIGLFGFGCVGYGLYEVLRRTPGLHAEIVRICVKHPGKARPIGQEHFTYRAEDIVADPGINVVVELIDDAEAAFQIVSESLRRGKAVVSANKRMIARHFGELLNLQRTYGSPLLYEAACCASIPVIRNLEEYYDNDLLQSVSGIVNGSTNYILTRTAREGVGYTEALGQAQALGFAESDPTLDTAGHDASYKLQILLAHAFGLVVKEGDLVSVGIEQLGESALTYAREKGYKIKLVAQAERGGDGAISACVMPAFLPPGDRLYGVDEVYNGIKIRSCFSDVQFFSGKGAGAFPTASAVLSDISALRYGYRYEYRKLGQATRLAAEEEVEVEVFAGYGGPEEGVVRSHFVETRESYLNSHGGYITGRMSLASLRKLRCDQPEVALVRMPWQREI